MSKRRLVFPVAVCLFVGSLSAFTNAQQPPSCQTKSAGVVFASHDSAYLGSLVTPAAQSDVLSESYDVMPLVNEFHEILTRTHAEKHTRLQRLYTSVYELKLLLAKQQRLQRNTADRKSDRDAFPMPSAPLMENERVPDPIPLPEADPPVLKDLLEEPATPVTNVSEQPIQPEFAPSESEAALRQLRKRYPEELLRQVTDQPINRSSLADSLFAIGSIPMALDIYEKLDDGGNTPEQYWIRFQRASCLRRLEKYDAARRYYRALAGEDAAGFLSECSRWWLDVIDERGVLEDKIAVIESSIQAMKDEANANRTADSGAGSPN